MAGLTPTPARVPPPRPARRRARRRGHTLVEVLVVVVVLALVAGVVLTNAGAWEPTRLEAAGRFVAAELRYARTRAVVTGRTHTLTVDDAAGTLTLADSGGFPVPDPAGGAAAPLVRRPGGVVPGASLGWVGTKTATAAGVAFAPDGSARPAGAAADAPPEDVFFAVQARDPAGEGWLFVRARVAGVGGRVWVDGPHRQDATAFHVLTAGEPDLADPE